MFKKINKTILFLFYILSLVPATKASFYFDTEVSAGNTMTATQMDIEITSPTINLGGVPTKDGLPDWYPGEHNQRTFFVSNEGPLDYNYGLRFSVIGNPDESDQELCNALEAEVYYVYESQEGDTIKDLIYQGFLPDFDLEYSDSDPLFSHMFLLASENIEHEYLIEVNLPIDSNFEDYSDSTCMFNIESYSWQRNSQPFLGFYDVDYLGNKIESADYDNIEECSIGRELIMLGDSDNDTNPVDEFNYEGEESRPDYHNPFIIGTSEEGDFPWMSSQSEGYADDFDVAFYNNTDDSLVRLTLSWSPGVTGTDYIEVDLNNGDFISQTNSHEGTNIGTGWEGMEFYQDTFIFKLEPGVNILNFRQFGDDGIIWDYIELRTIGCSANIGDIVINEIMWPGSSEHENDEWVELRNMTDEDIDLTGWKLQGAAQSDHEIELSGVIPADGYFLITHFPTDHDQGNEKAAILDTLKDDVEVLVDDTLDIRDQGEQIKLLSPIDEEIDSTPESPEGNPGWVEGLAGQHGHDDDKWVSMERRLVPGDGTDGENWASCNHDECDDGKYWDEDGGQDYGTPGYENLYTEEVLEADLLLFESLSTEGFFEEETVSGDTGTGGTSCDPSLIDLITGLCPDENTGVEEDGVGSVPEDGLLPLTSGNDAVLPEEEVQESESIEEPEEESSEVSTDESLPTDETSDESTESSGGEEPTE